MIETNKDQVEEIKIDGVNEALPDAVQTEFIQEEYKEDTPF